VRGSPMASSRRSSVSMLAEPTKTTFDQLSEADKDLVASLSTQFANFTRGDIIGFLKMQKNDVAKARAQMKSTVVIPEPLASLSSSFTPPLLAVWRVSSQHATN
jgi:hypothetical protein